MGTELRRKSVIEIGMVKGASFFAICATISAMIAACGNSVTTPRSQSTDKPTQSADKTIQSTDKPTQSLSPTVPSGLMVESIEVPHSVVIGFIDPKSGQYSRYATFDVGNVISLPSPNIHIGDQQGGDDHLDPDIKRYAVVRTVNDAQHAGWVDTSGVFTDVNADSGIPGPFGGPPASYEANSFDGFGNFYYGELNGNNDQRVFKLPKGQTRGGTFIGETFAGGTTGLIRQGNGEVTIGKAGCNTQNYLTPDEYLTVAKDNGQIYKSSVANDPGLGSCGDGETPLLPTTNTSYVDDPIASPDGRQVVFKRGHTELWVVDASGSGLPQRIDTGSLDLSLYRLIGWK